MSAAFSRTLLIIPFLLSCALMSEAQEQQNPFAPQATQLVSDIMNRAGSPGFVTLDVQNKSSLSPLDVAQARKAIEAQLRAANVRLVKPERAVAEITVTISENIQGLLWVAEVKQGVTTQTSMLQSEQVPASPNALRNPSLTLRRAPVFSQADATQIVDFALLSSSTLVVLEPERLVTYSVDNAHWKQTNTAAIRHDNAWPRDLRGRIVVHPSQLTIFLPGVQCLAPLAANAISSLNCNQTDDPWQLDNNINAFFPASRNFFSGVVRGVDVSLPPFYSAASVGDANPVLLLTATDGRVRLYSSFSQAPHVYSGWGSDIAAVHSTCGSQWQVLITRPGDRLQPDALQAMEVANREPVPVSAPLDLSGSVASLWTSQDGKTARLITQDPDSRRYEASLISIDCH